MQRRKDEESAARKAGNITCHGASGTVAELLIGDKDSIPAYPELACAMVRRRLQLSGEQEQRLRDAVARFWTRHAELMKEAAKRRNPSLAGNNSDFFMLPEESYQQLVEENRKQIEEILTPQQLSALKDFILMKETAVALLDGDILKTIGATEQQRVKLRHLFAETRKEEGRVWDEASQQALKLLTPRQHELFREKFEREGWW